MGITTAQENPELVISSGHRQKVNSIDFSPDDAYIASAGDDNKVKVYHLRMQRQLYEVTKHSMKVNHVAFSPDGKYLVSITGREILVHLHPSGAFHKKIVFNSESTFNSIYITNNNILLFGDMKKGMQLFDITSGVQLPSFSELNSRQFAVDENLGIIYGSAPDYKDTVGVASFELSSGKMLNYYPRPNLYMGQYALASKKGILAVQSEPGLVELLDLKSGKFIRTIKASPGVLLSLSISPDEKTIVTTAFDNKVNFWNLETGELKRSIVDLSPVENATSMSMMPKDVDFSKNGELIAICYSDLIFGRQLNRVEWFNSESMESVGFHEGDMQIALSISIDHTGTLLTIGTVGGDIGIRNIDLSNGNQKQFVHGSAYHQNNGEYLLAYNSGDHTKAEIELYNLPDLSLSKRIETKGYTQVSLSQSGKYCAYLVQEPIQGENGQMRVDPKIYVRQFANELEMFKIEKALTDMPLGMLFSPDDKELYLLYTLKIEVFSLTEKKLVRTLITKLTYPDKAPLSPDGNFLINVKQNKVIAINLLTGEEQTIIELPGNMISTTASFSSDQQLIAIACYDFGDNPDHAVLLYEWENKRLIKRLTCDGNFILQTLISPNKRDLFVATDNGVVSMWDIEKGEIKAHFLADLRDDLIIITPKGYYKSTKSDMQQIAFRKDGNLYSFDQFDLTYNRPDIVLNEIGFAHPELLDSYHSAWEKRVKRMGIDPSLNQTSFAIPTLELKNKNLLPLETVNEKIEIRFQALDKSEDLSALHVWINEVPIYGTAGLNINRKAGATLDSTISLELSNGVNKIELSVANMKGNESLKESFYINYNGESHASNLYFIGIGAKEYHDKSMNLDFAAKDIRDVAEVLKKSTAYEKVYIDTFMNQHVNLGMLDSIKSRLTQIGIHDQLIVMFSGHGVIDEQLNYYLGSYDIDFQHPEDKGIAYDELNALFDGISVRKKLLLLDACHSGELDKEDIQVEENHNTSLIASAKGDLFRKYASKGNSYELMKDIFADIRRGTGTTVIASSSGKYFSYEDKTHQNGIYTYALKEGLQGKADENQDQEIRVNELKKYLYQRVYDLTNGRQQPTTRQENAEYDYRVY